MNTTKNKHNIDCTAVTQSADDNSTKLATTAYVDNAAGGGGGYPTAVYTSASTTISASTVQSFTHNLAVNQTDVQDAKYMVIYTNESSFASVTGLNYFGNDYFGELYNPGSTDAAVGIMNGWNSGDPANERFANWQANTIKVRPGAQGITGKLIIWQMFE